MKAYFSGLILSTVLLFSSVQCNDSTHLLNEGNVLKHRQYYEQLFYKRSWGRTAIYGGVAAGLTYGAYSVLSYFAGSQAAAGGVLAPIPTGDYLSRFGNWITDSETWINIGRYASTGLVVSKLQTEAKDVLQKETILWFTAHYAPYNYAFREIGWYIQQSIQNGTDIGQKEKDAMLIACKRLAQHAEQVTAFMQWKAAQLNGQKKQEQALAIADAFFAQTDAQLKTLVNGIKNNDTTLAFAVDTMFLGMQHECQRFAQVEGSNWIDPNMLVMIANSLS